MDKVIVTYFCRTVGVDESIFPQKTNLLIPPKLNMDFIEVKSQVYREPERISKVDKMGERRGMPILLTSFLSSAWQLPDMSQLAGNGQHDAMEFLQSFLSIIEKDCVRFQTSICSAKETRTKGKERYLLDESQSDRRMNSSKESLSQKRN